MGDMPEGGTMTYKVTILPSITRTSRKVDILCHVKIFVLSCVEALQHSNTFITKSE